MKILICDDSAVARKLITRSIVQDTSLHLLEAQDGHEALKILAEQNIDVLFLDLTMPVMDGFEVLESCLLVNTKPKLSSFRVMSSKRLNNAA